MLGCRTPIPSKGKQKNGAYSGGNGLSKRNPLESKILTTPDECGINPVGLCVEMGGFWYFLASGVSYTQEGKKLTRYSLCVHMLAYW